MTSDEERREVAAKLRAKHRERTRPGVFVPQDAGMQVWDYLRDLEACLPDGESAFTVLADLIEPSTCRFEWSDTERGLVCSNCREAVSCNEPGHAYYVTEETARCFAHCPMCGAKVVE